MKVAAEDLKPGDVVELIRDNIGRVQTVSEISAADLIPDWKGPKTLAAPLIMLEIRARGALRMPCGFMSHFVTDFVDPDRMVTVRERKER